MADIRNWPLARAADSCGIVQLTLSLGMILSAISEGASLNSPLTSTSQRISEML